SCWVTRSLALSAGLGSQLSVAAHVTLNARLVGDAQTECADCGGSGAAGCRSAIGIGAVVSMTVIVWLHVLALLHASVAVHVRVIVFSCVQRPGAVASVNVMAGAASQLSV